MNDKVRIPKDDLVEPGTYVVPTYNDQGRLTGKPVAVGSSEEISAVALRVRNSALSKKGERIVPKSSPSTANLAKRAQVKKPSKVKIVDPVPNMDDVPYDTFIPSETSKPEPEVHSKIDIVFKNKFGKIKVKAIGALETSISITLVFESDDDVSFIPEQGEELELIVNSYQTFKVLFPGDVITWMDNKKKLMTLYKRIENEAD